MKISARIIDLGEARLERLGRRIEEGLVAISAAAGAAPAIRPQGDRRARRPRKLKGAVFPREVVFLR